MSLTIERLGEQGLNTEEYEQNQRFQAYLGRVATLAQLEQAGTDNNLTELAEVITTHAPIVIVSMEFYGGKETGIQGSGGLGILAADIRRVSEQLGIPLVVITPFYSVERHQQLNTPGKFVNKEIPPPENYLFDRLGGATVNTQSGRSITLDTYTKKLGSTQIITVTNQGFGELYPGSNSSDYRLYQEVRLRFCGLSSA